MAEEFAEELAEDAEEEAAAVVEAAAEEDLGICARSSANCLTRAASTTSIDFAISSSTLRFAMSAGASSQAHERQTILLSASAERPEIFVPKLQRKVFLQQEHVTAECESDFE